MQDKLRMYGAKAERHVFLFTRALLVAKKRDDVTMSVKALIEVTLWHLEFVYNLASTYRLSVAKEWSYEVYRLES